MRVGKPLPSVKISTPISFEKNPVYYQEALVQAISQSPEIPKERSMNERYEAGMKKRRQVLGDTHVDRSQEAQTKFDEPFQTLITESAWGNVWSRDGISDRERSMLTLALLAALGNFDEIPMHIRATTQTKASRQDVLEAFQHVAIYAGVPRANHAIKLAKQTYSEMDADQS